MKKHLKRLLTFALAFLLVAIPAMSVGALPTPAQTGEAKMVKRLTTTGNLVAVPNYTFTFTSDAFAVDDNTSPTLVTDMPDLGTTVTYVGNETWKAPLSEPGLSPDADAHATLWYVDKEINLVSGITWPHAGQYTYKIRETAGSDTGITYSTEVYRLVIQVKNGSSGLEVTNVAFQTEDGTAKAANPLFENFYDVKGDLSITNKLIGDYADLTRQFDYTLNLVVPSGSTATPTALITRKGGGTEVYPIAAGSNTGIKLADGDKIDITGLAVGTKYTLTEAAATSYTPAVTPTVNGAAQAKQTGTISTAYTIGATPNEIAIGEKTNTAAWENTMLDPPTPTGILIDTLPYLLLVLAGVGGLVAFIVVKRRRSH